MESNSTEKKNFLSALAVDLTPLKVSREFRVLYLGQFVSGFGSAVSYVVLPWQMYQLTKSSFAVGMLGVAEFVPMFFMSLIGGALADAVDRRRLIFLAEVVLVLGCLGLMANALLPHPQVWLIFLIAACFAAINGIHRPALEALTPRIVAPELQPAVAALSTFRYSFNFIVGPAIGGVLASQAGAAVAYGLDAATFVFSVGMIALLKTVPPPSSTEPPSLQSIREGWRYARSRQELLGTYLIDINAMFFGMPLALFPAMADHLKISVGLLYSMPAVGSLVVSLTSGWTERVERHGRAVAWAAAVWGLAIVGFGLSQNLWLALFFLALAGGADNVSGLFRMTIWNQTIPDHYRGRLAGIEMLSYLTGPYLGNAEAGLVASCFGLQASIVSGGVLCVLGSGVLVWLLPRFYHYQGHEGLAHKAAEEAALNQLRIEN
ncbi:MAG: MFS transporter [Blastocatellia bacterium]|nr:MFS transporter [Blastocatellia bacterium]